jgi:hypothetical protein
LSIFSTRANSECAEVIAVSYGNSSPSIRELVRHRIDKVRHEGTSVAPTHDVLVSGRRSTASAKRAGGRSRRKSKRALMRDTSGMSDIASISHGGNSAKKEALRILSAALGAISPCMRNTFVDRRYSPSTSMCLVIGRSF